MGIGAGLAWDLWFLAAPPLLVVIPWVSDDGRSGARRLSERSAGFAPEPEPEHPV